MGCLVERYLSDLRQSIPEVDIYFPIRDYDHIDKLFQKILLTSKSYQMDYQNRVLSTLPHSAYLRISEGCNNHCSYCAIPLIRGSFRSRDFNSLIAQSQMNNTPVFELTQEQVEKTGSVWENMKRNRDDFSVTFETLAKTIIALTN